MAHGACRHSRGGCLKHLFHEHRAVRETSVPAISSDSSRRCVDDMELLRTLALVRSHRPASQELIGAAIAMGYMQIPSRIDYSLRLPVARRCPAYLPIRCDGDHCR